MSPSGGYTGPQPHDCWGANPNLQPFGTAGFGSRTNVQNHSRISANGGGRSQIQVDSEANI